ncbi:Sodium/calcium exchanger protein-domain-containing protein [Myxozyma melibiosi]|uniref:Sodium/calcium exchanger protein-domain-containing protein n=1 Tax=Myxozyma melibiosi TaxID=54550 RepID=A0ABR1F7Z3_9ASCO
MSLLHRRSGRISVLRCFLLFGTCLCGVLYLNMVRTAAITSLEHSAAAVSKAAAISYSSTDSIFYNEVECKDINKVADQCAFAKTYCTDDEIGFFNYIEFYYCSPTTLRLPIFLILSIWLITVFTTIGITASDFLCPNLNTISQIFGMSESLAGVTLLALGNGSPDVFSTYAAMKAGSGSLAVGELIGAASFITSVVGGSMAIICPFSVDRASFIRDLGFFTVAVAFAMYCLHDGYIAWWECAAMVGFYLTYVVFVVSWHWWLTRGLQLHAGNRSYDDVYGAPLQPSLSNTSIPSFYSDIVNSGGVMSADDLESAPLLPQNSLATSVEIERAVDRYALRPINDERHENINQVMHIRRPQGDTATNNLPGYSESPGNLTSSTPIRASLIGALDLRSAVERGRLTSNTLSDENPGKLYSRLSRSTSRGHPAYHSKDRRHHSMQISTNYQHAAAALRTDSESPHSNSTQTETSRPQHNRSYSSDNVSGSRDSKLLSPTSAADDHWYRGGRPPYEMYRIENTAQHSSAHRPSLSLVTSGSGHSGPLTAGSIQSRAGRETRSRSNSVDRRPRSPSPYDRFLSFMPTSALQPPEIPVGSSRLHEDDLMADDDRMQETDAMLSPLSHSQHLSLPSASPSLSISRDNLSDISEVDSSIISSSQGSIFSQWKVIWADIKKTLFPTIGEFSEKTPLNRFISILAVPTVLLLTVTIPVIEIDHPDEDYANGSDHDVPILRVDTSSLDGHDNAGDHEDNESGKPLYKGWSKWLLCVQCLCSSIVVYSMNSFDSENFSNGLSAAVITGLVLFLGIYYFTESNSAPTKLLPILCFAGFGISISWISAIAVEAVGVLKAYGIIFGISDAILGLTVFALGNSLGDYVSNVTVAKMGYPMMAISACFGSPMLNILVGIGVSGLILLPGISDYTDGDAYELEIAPSLIISAATLFLNLLLYLVWVPYSGWRMTRVIGAASIGLWALGTSINLVLEVVSS